MVTKRPLTSSKAKTVSKRVRSSTLGDHISKDQRDAYTTKVGTSRADGGFSFTRKNKKAARGVVSNVLAAPEGKSLFRKSPKASFLQDVRKQSLLRTILLFGVSVALICAVVYFVAHAVFRSSIDSKLLITSEEVTGQLAEVSEDDAVTYVLVAADLDYQQRENLGDGADAIMLVCLNPQHQKVSMISFPLDTRVQLSDGKIHTLHDAAAEGTASLVTAVSSLTSKPVHHVVETDASGIAGLVKKIDGVEITLLEEVDDPRAGSEYIASGHNTLDSEETLTVLRATNYSKA